MRFLVDTQVAGRFFPRDAEVHVIEADEASFFVLPDPGSHTTLCTVPARNLARLRQFRIVLVNQCVGLMDEQIRWGLDAEEVMSSIAYYAPGCEIISLDLTE